MSNIINHPGKTFKNIPLQHLQFQQRLVVRGGAYADALHVRQAHGAYRALFRGHGVNLNMMKRAAGVLARFHAAIRQAVLGEDYIAADETYFKNLVPEKNSKGKGVRKGYFWVIVAVNSRLLYVVYEDGSRSGDVTYLFSRLCVL